MMTIERNYGERVNTSFIIARKEELSEAQKDAIVDFALDRMLGLKIASNEEELEKYLEEFDPYLEFGDEAKKKMHESLAQGLSLFSTIVFFDENFQFADLLNGLWEDMERADPDSLVRISTSLED